MQSWCSQILSWSVDAFQYKIKITKFRWFFFSFSTEPEPVEEITCRITEPLRVMPFERTTMYGFMGTCEHIAVSSCEPVPGFDVRVTVDFLTESMENGAVGLLVNDLRYVSREDGFFDDGGQSPIPSTPTHREYSATPSTRVIVDFGEGMTNITFDVDTDPNDPLDIDIEIVHVYGKDTLHVRRLVTPPLCACNTALL